MFDVTILGKYGPFPKADGACSSYLIRTENTNIVVDMGSGSLSNLQEFIDIKDIDAIILTHLHSDHMSDILVLRYALLTQKMEKIDVYMPKTPENINEAVMEIDRFNNHTTSDELEVKINDLNISFKKMKHPVETYAVKISNGDRVFVFSADTKFSNDIIDFCKGANTVLFDCAILEEERTVNFVHTSAYQAAYTAKIAGIEKLLLTHINPNADENLLLQEAIETFEKSEVVGEKQTYEI